MKITINENPMLSDTEIIINCRETNEEIGKILSILRCFDKKLTGIKDGQIHIIDAGQVLYIDTVDRHTFIYTKTAVFETPLRLYEIEERLAGADFFRSSKSAVINMAKISSLYPELGGRIELTMQNGEKLTVSRQYAISLKQKLGLR